MLLPQWQLVLGVLQVGRIRVEGEWFVMAVGWGVHHKPITLSQVLPVAADTTTGRSTLEIKLSRYLFATQLLLIPTLAVFLGDPSPGLGSGPEPDPKPDITPS